MASCHRRHFFAHPEHPLLRTQYGGDSDHACDICRSQLAGLAGYRCGACDIDVHETCADYFNDSIVFFAHPWHRLTLSRIPGGAAAEWTCDLCEEECAPGSFVYRCVRCMFDVHPLCKMLPQTVRSPLHPGRDLFMVPSAGQCSACHGDLPVWQYVCGGACFFRLHIACVAGAPGGSDNMLAGQCSAGAAQPGCYAGQAGSGGYSIGEKPSRGARVAKFLLKTSFRVAIDAANDGGGLAAPVLSVLEADFN
ncbi:hypothetical protein HU200_046108 [Digitaria exilis]|uniref:Phorbol-ester/DAG-type domain-containing protein n=1 Tax=Digitaria exilis TaxID=1010633 RepID=A0A835EE99_9POAL|nr:hypothetical protein HU200_046108 [Digitaria exilis]